MAPEVLPRVVLAIAFAVLIPATTGADVGAGTQPPYTVLAVHWGPEDFPSAPVLNAAIRKGLTPDANLPIHYFAEYLESDLFDTRKASEALAGYIRRKYQGRRIDVVMALADPALRFVLDYKADLFPNAAIVYSGVAVPESVGPNAGGVTGELRGTAYIETLELALKLHPSTEQVFVIANGRDARNVEAVRAALGAAAGRVRLTYLDEPSVSDLIATVAAIPPRSLVLYVWYTERDRNSRRDIAEVASLVAKAAAVPVYGTNERYLGSGVVGGVVRSTQGTGVRMAEMALEIIAGRRAEDIPIENPRLVPMVDWRQVRRWHINPSRLPGGSDILFKTPTAWESYGPYMFAIFLVILAQLVLIAGMVTQRARRHGAEDALRTNEATLRMSYDRIRNLAARLINAQETARASIARGLHDDVCQDLVALSLAICRLKQSSKRSQTARVQEEFTRLQQWTMTLADGVRRLSHDLHPATLGLLGLASAVKGHCLEVRKRHGVDVRFIADGDLGQLDREVAVCLFRMAQEALRNGLVHGSAQHMVVSISRCGGDIEMAVTDDGTGFDYEAVRRNASGLGLVSMEERAYALGGDVRVTSCPGLGTTVYVRVPAAAATVQETETASAPVCAPEPDAELTTMERA